MKNRKKQFIRAYAAEHGITYQQAFAATNEQTIRSFHAPGFSETPAGGRKTDRGTVTFSARCDRCNAFIHCGTHPHRGRCDCGRRYQVVFVDRSDWTMPIGPRCMDCGFEFKATERAAGRSPWHVVNEWQHRCDLCHQRHLAYDRSTARPGYVLVQEHGAAPTELAGTVRCVLRTPEASRWPYLIERVLDGQSVLMTSEGKPFNGEIVTLRHCTAGDEVFGGHWNHPPGQLRHWTPLRIVVVGEVGPNVTLMRTLERALGARSMWLSSLIDVHAVKAHLLERFPTFDPGLKQAQLDLLDEIVRQALRGRVAAVATLLGRLEDVARRAPPQATDCG